MLLSDYERSSDLKGKDNKEKLQEFVRSVVTREPLPVIEEGDDSSAMDADTAPAGVGDAFGDAGLEGFCASKIHVRAVLYRAEEAVRASSGAMRLAGPAGAQQELQSLRGAAFVLNRRLLAAETRYGLPSHSAVTKAVQSKVESQMQKPYMASDDLGSELEQQVAKLEAELKEKTAELKMQTDKSRRLEATLHQYGILGERHLPPADARTPFTGDCRARSGVALGPPPSMPQTSSSTKRSATCPAAVPCALTAGAAP